MTKSQNALADNPISKANVLSYLLFWWLNDFFRKGKENDLQEENLFRLVDFDKSVHICDILEKNWNEDLEKSKRAGIKPSLARAIMKTYYRRWIVFGVLALLEEMLLVTNPIFLAGLLRYFEGKTPLHEAYLYAAGIVMVTLLITLCHHAYFFNLQRMGFHIRAGASGLMYQKTLRLSQRALVNTTTGQIVNLGATDVMRFDWVVLFLHFIWIAPLQSVFVVYLLWKDLGPSSLAGLVILFAIMLGQTLLGRQFGRIRGKMAVLSDSRIRTMNEVLTSMRVIKMYTWEKPFKNLVASIRRKEVYKVLTSSVLKAVNFSMMFVATRLIVFVTFSIYVSRGGWLTPSKVFSALAFYNVIRVSMGIFFPIAIEKLSESLVSMKRIEKFLLLDEIDPVLQTDDSEDDKTEVEFINFSASWTDKASEERDDATLSNINFSINSKKLFAIVGPVGSGKSSLLSAILRELPPAHGELLVHGKIAYVCQVPWVFSGTIRENILFGEEYDAERYQAVVKACALEKDLNSLDHGDDTLVGERGVTLSGGQKARVNLARATYRENVDIILMDDPLSAVDATVAKQLFDECICGFLKDKVRVLVTHQLQFLKDADEIVILKQGEVAGQGTFDELQADGTDFAALLKKDEEAKSPTLSATRSFKFLTDEDELSDLECHGIAELSAAFSTESLYHRTTNNVENNLTSSLSMHKLDVGKSPQKEESSEPLLAKKDQADYVASVQAEEVRVQGSVGFKVYWEYLKTSKPVLVVLILLILANHSLYFICDWWISVWASKSDIYHSKQLGAANNSALTTSPTDSSLSVNFTDATPPSNGSELGLFPVPFDDHYYIFGCGLLTLAFCIAMYSRAILQFWYCGISAKRMHNKMFQAILRAPIRFFDVNPVGRILNRFSKDMGQIDEMLPLTLMDFVYILFTILAIIALSVAVNYFVLIVVIPLLVYFVWLRQYYIKTSRDIKRMEGASRSPVFSHLSSTLQGLTTVRAFKMQEKFEEEFHQRQDLHSSCWFLFLAGSRWLAVRLDGLSAIFIGTVAFGSLLTASMLNVDAGQVGLTLSYSMMLMGMFQWGVRQSTEVENLMTSVERVQEYYNLPSEAPHEIPDCKPPPEWPQYGIITFENLSYAHYTGGPDVLHKIRLNVRAHEKVGIVGRTGAGKSSLISTLFRMNEFSNGEVYIDGVAISQLGLTDLRAAISVIPQDPTLFSGTMRKNLDPFSIYTDAELWDALEQVQLKNVIESFSSKLEAEMSESGSNFSVGQRQLVCLARAILRKNKILIIDEATANVDMRTDRLIQQTMRQTFQNCTVLTVAHRINTIIDSDRVLVLQSGEVVEFEEPHLLLENKDSLFTDMVEATGKSETRMLRKMAEEAYEDRHNPRSDPDVKDSDKSYLSRFLPVPGSYDHLELESNV